jgi:hypothetical protein
MDSAETRERSRVEVVDGAPSPPAAKDANPAKLAESVDPGANVVKRLWRIEQEIEAVEKSQTATVKMEGGGQYTYKYSGHDLILAFVRPLLAKHGVKHWPSTIKHERAGNLTMLTLRLRFINVDNPEDWIEAEVVNYGADKGDKGGTKALTNAVREGIKKALNITSEEDKYADEHTDFDAQEGASRTDLEAAKEKTRDALEKWAKSFKAAVETAATVKDVERLERDNKSQLTAEELPDVTRTFFIELITGRKTTLKQAGG